MSRPPHHTANISQPQPRPRKMPPKTMIKDPRLQALKRKPARDPDSPAPPSSRRPAQIIHHGLQWPYYDVATARNVSYLSFAYGVLKLHEQVRYKGKEGKKKWRHMTRTSFPTRAEVEQNWLYQLQHSILSWAKLQSLKSEIHKPAATNIWKNMKDNGLDLKRVENKDPRKKFRKAVGRPSSLSPPTFQRYIGGTFNVVHAKRGLKRTRHEDGGLQASVETKRKNEQKAAYKWEERAAKRAKIGA